MKTYHLDKKISALIFDMDLTLYSHEEYGRSQIDRLIEKLSERQGLSFAEMRDEIEAYRKDWAASHHDRQLSLSAVLAAWGVSMEENIRWREETYQPERYLHPDPRLRNALEGLSASYALAVVTNNVVSIARRTLAVLGVGHCFRGIVGLDTCGAAKPHREPFLEAARMLGAPPEACVSIGDRYDMDLRTALELGMGGILVDGVEDVYRLWEERGSAAFFIRAEGFNT
ncbi:MAG: HAD family hydrolase [Treponema sp.]|jgi:phosphoglycolate phosphatase/putative hydrolase of the HAD superfamily|nr:HAD family hydrolase [Treponema sp.]